MADDRLRQLRRRFAETGLVEDEAALLRAEVRAGILTADGLGLAAYLDHPAAVQAWEGPLPAFDGAGWEGVAAQVAGLERWGLEALFRAGAAIVRAIPIYCDRFDGPDDRLLEAMDLLEDVILDPGERTRAALDAVPGFLAEAVEQAWGAAACANATERLYRALVERGLEANHVRQLVLESGADPAIMRALRGELVPWALGRGDALGERDRVGGRFLGRVDGLVRRILCVGDAVWVADSRGRLTAWDIDGERVQELAGIAHDIYAMTRAGERWVLADMSGRLHLLGAAGGEALGVSEEVGDGVRDLVTLGAEQVAAACRDGTLRVWSLAGDVLREERRWDAHDGGVSALCARAGRLLSAGRDGRARVWDAAGQEFGAPLEHGGEVLAAAWLDDARVVTAGDDHELHVWTAGQRSQRLRGHSGTIHAMAAAGDGRLATVAGDGTTRLWRADSGDALACWVPRGTLLAAAFAPDGRLVIGTRRGTLRVYPLTPY